ncbi:D-glycero-alpha-D-manno-heptose 1-phosphate guanylyltransferase [compost metagenome]
MRAIILAGGQGTRLRPYTVVLPKPLMPIGEFPILEVVVKQLVAHGFTHLTMAVNHQAELIRSFFNSGKKWGVTIDYALETTPLGTMGPLTLIDDLPEHFLVMNGDILTDLDYSGFYLDHVTADRIFSIATYRREVRVDFGVLQSAGGNVLSGFEEKPRHVFDVSMGVYMVSRRAVSQIPREEPFGFDDLMHQLLRAQLPPYLYRFDGYWLDIGRPDDYMVAIDDFERLKHHFLSPAKEERHGLRSH